MSHSGSVLKRGRTWTAYWFTTCPGGVVHRKGQAPCDAGHRLQRSRGGFKLKSEAAAHLRVQVSAVADGTYTEVVDKTMTVRAFLLEHWLPAMRTEAIASGEPRRASTVAAYRNAVTAWILPHLGGERLLGLTPARVESALASLREHGGRGGKPLTRGAQVAHGVLRMALDDAVRRGFVTRNAAVSVGRPGVKARAMQCWTAAEAQTFLAGAAGDRLYAAWVLLLARGLRRGELAGLGWADVDLDAGRLRVVRTRIVVDGKVVESTPKTEAGRRTVPLDPGLVKVLRAHRERQLFEGRAGGIAWTDSGHVFVREDGLPFHPESISQRFERLCRRLGVPPIRLHDLRHTAASLMLEDGTPVKVAAEMLGHANPNITQSIYQHVLPGMAEQAGERLFRRLLGGETTAG